MLQGWYACSVMKIGIQGFEGSFHHQAAQQFFSGDFDLAPFENFRQVFEALETGMIDRAVVAIENSLYGSINDTYDLLLQHKPWIVGEVYLHVRLDLLGTEDAEMSDITDVYSQAPALGEAKLFLRENLPAVTQHEYPDTAMSARFVAKRADRSMAAIASEMAGEIHGLQTLAEGIEDHKHNYTRFVILTKQHRTTVESDKTSIILHTSHKPGALYRALGAFANQDINLSKLESRPVVDDTAWSHIFYLDFEAALNEAHAQEALNEIADLGDEITVLGTYQSGTMPNGLIKS